MTFDEFSTTLAEWYGTGYADFQVRDLRNKGIEASPQRIAGWLRRLKATGRVKYCGDGTEYKGYGGYGPGRAGNAVEPFWVWVR